MIIPNTLHHFQHPTLIITSDHTHARIFLAQGELLEIQKEISLPHERIEASDSDISQSAAEYNDAPRLERFIKTLSENAAALSEQHSIEVIDLVMPAEVEHLFLEHCTPNLKAQVQRTLKHDLMKEDILKVVERLFE